MINCIREWSCIFQQLLWIIALRAYKLFNKSQQNLDSALGSDWKKGVGAGDPSQLQVYQLNIFKCYEFKINLWISEFGNFLYTEIP